MRRMRSMWAAAKGWWGDYPWLDWVFVALLVGTHGGLAWWRDPPLLVSDLASDPRGSLYETTAAVGALIFGFATAAIAFFYSNDKSSRLILMQQVMGDRLMTAWRASLAGPLVAVAVAVGGLIGDSSGPGSVWYGFVVEASLLLLLARCLRLRWLFVSTLRLVARDAMNPSTSHKTGTMTPVSKPGRRS